ncbi:30S ribosomal protein S7 [Coxiella endosymbiont of Ornithodoros maritimus]|uniref:30S ribosomal protein S7 n=1 Tax=Coxiella endosymbiont of Ornithodoros maritimus TaxID=1656172 RepID=UPI00226528AD|nr:30S ribosomal protein S7 [Coxiella endosymbiont of Ornithodoros maritimus]
MARRKTAPKRETLPDPLFHSELLAKFINAVMRNGKKSVAEKIVYGAFDVVAKRVQNKSGEQGDGGGESGGRVDGIKKRSLGDIRTDENARALALETFKEALNKVMPNVEVKSRRVGGSTYQVPVEIRMARRQALARRWLVEYANKRNEKTMVLRLAREILDAVEGRGAAIKKREDVHRMAKANQAFAHYRW